MAVVAHARVVPRPHALAEANPGFARSWLYRSAMRGLFGVQAGNTVEVERRACRRPLLVARIRPPVGVSGDDFNKAAWSTEHLRRIRCALADLATRFQADGRTVFATALAPDKSSAYRPWGAIPPDCQPSGWAGALRRTRCARRPARPRHSRRRGARCRRRLCRTIRTGAAQGHALAAQVIFERLSRLRAQADVATGEARAQDPKAPK